jgi:hypothetical protein
MEHSSNLRWILTLHFIICQGLILRGYSVNTGCKRNRKFIKTTRRSNNGEEDPDERMLMAIPSIHGFQGWVLVH